MLEDYFAEDDAQLVMAYALRRVVADALLDDDAWSWEWIFGEGALEDEDLPPRHQVLELFGARDLAFQTRIQYQLWLEGIVATMRFPIPALHRRFTMKMSGLLAEYDRAGDTAATLAMLEEIWRNPGVTDAQLWRLCAERDVFQRQPDVHALILELLADDYLISRNRKNGGWYFTGVNPQRMAEDLRLSRPGLSAASIARGWSQWW